MEKNKEIETLEEIDILTEECHIYRPGEEYYYCGAPRFPIPDCTSLSTIQDLKATHCNKCGLKRCEKCLYYVRARI